MYIMLMCVIIVANLIFTYILRSMENLHMKDGLWEIYLWKKVVMIWLEQGLRFFESTKSNHKIIKSFMLYAH